jgi:hypothetical protein
MEALKVQAVAARTYAYYKIKTAGSVKDGTGDQVYSCGKSPSTKHYQAVKETAGQVLRYKGTVICAFYVAGAKPTASSCVAKSSDSDPTYTEKYVTYNAGKTGNSITQTKLGWVSTSNVYNRGCMSQNGSHCLSLHKKTYKQILPFYYGSDIEIVTATGSCVVPPTPKYPVLTINAKAETISGQERDLCTAGQSKGIFDWRVGQKTVVNVDVKNSGTEVAKNVEVGLWAEQPYVAVKRWNIYSDNKGGSFTLNDTDGMQKIGHDDPAKSFTLWLGSISPGETKRIELKVEAKKFSLGKVDHPDLRGWVAKIEGYYAKSSFSAAPTKNVSSYQKQNGGDLRDYVQTDVLDVEICDNVDNDCDGEVDEGCSGGSDATPGSDAGPDPGADATGPQPDSGAGGNGDGVVRITDDPDALVLEGSGCSVGRGGAPAQLTWLLLAALLLVRRRR